MRACVALILGSLAGCSGDAPRQEVRAKPVSLPADESRWLPSKDRVSTGVVGEHLIDASIPAGGTLGKYEGAQGPYQLGLIHMASADNAAFLLLDVKKAVTGAQYLPNMGGYFGVRGGVPLYVFAKGPYVAMVKGLSMERADPIARVFAARIPLK